MSRCLMSWRIDAGLEWRNADAAEGIDETFGFGALRDIDIENALDGVGHLCMRHGRADHLADGGIGTARRPAERDLVPLLAALVDAQYADVSHRVVTARI